CMYAYMFTHPGGKLLFMGNEFGSTSEWNYKSELQWDLLDFEPHSKLKDYMRDLNILLRSEPALYERQFKQDGFEWVDLNHRQESVVVYRRKGKDPDEELLVILNFTPVARLDWKVYAQGKSKWKEIFNSDAKKYYGTGDVYNPSVETKMVDKKGKWYEINVHLPPLGAVILK
ncbi:MAG: 1,4-alpha-glucan branching protein GlgB, partial [Chitinophagaceae bacterium]